jgi:hypothetical protein
VDVEDFIERWRKSGSESSNKDSFLKELCRLLGVPEPNVATGDPEVDTYVFEADARLLDEDGRPSVGKMDLYRMGSFILEAKQGTEERHKKRGTAKRQTAGWKTAMSDAYGQALGYARTLDDPPPFVIACDLGYCFDLYACFDGSGVYRKFPVAHQSRIYLTDLRDPTKVQLLRDIWLRPLDLDPRKRSERITLDLAEQLAHLAKRLEDDGHPSEVVAKFLMRCLFTMFAEDIGLLKDKLFSTALEQQWIPEPATFKEGVESLWDAMNAGKRFYVLGKLLRFNGGLFAEPVALPLAPNQLRLLHKAARCNWSEVDPAIFGTVLEQALRPEERHRLGAHFTPRAYVERLIGPLLEKPMRDRWNMCRAQVRELVPPDEAVTPANLKRAAAIVRSFHAEMRGVEVLDPACGSGNFLYVALDVLKRLESEVLETMRDLDPNADLLSGHLLVGPEQFHGIEVRYLAKEIADLILWIGYLQWHFRLYGREKTPPEPVLRDIKNIAHRDALIEYERKELVLGRDGKPLTEWDRTSFRRHPVTGEYVPDEDARVEVVRYVNPTQASWPPATIVIGNPPYMGVRTIRHGAGRNDPSGLGDSYVDALRAAYPELPDTADLVMYFWHRAANLVEEGKIQAFGLITTNSIVQDYSRPVIDEHLGREKGTALTLAIADHPWVVTGKGAAKGAANVRVAMTIGMSRRRTDLPVPVVGTVTNEGDDPSGVRVEFRAVETINSSLSGGANARSVGPLRANGGICFQGVVPANDGFKLLSVEAVQALGYEVETLPNVIRPYIIGRDLVGTPKQKFIDMFGLTEQEAAEQWPNLFQHLYNHVYPERRQNKRPAYRDRWWLFAETRPAMRKALTGLSRYIATPYTAKHRPFFFVDANVIPDAMAYAIASDDPFILGVLSSRVHEVWALTAGGRMGIGNDPRYTSDKTFAPFPFPVADEVCRQRIGELAEAIDRHRKDRQAAHPELTVTDMYNALALMRQGKELDDHARDVYAHAQLAWLRKLHDDLDVAVCAAYGWSASASATELVEALAKLNVERVEQERRGDVHWIRPDIQVGRAVPRAERPSQGPKAVAVTRTMMLPWPKDFGAQLVAVRDVVAVSDRLWSVEDLMVVYSGGKSRDLARALDALAMLGEVAAFGSGRDRRWKGLAKAGAVKPESARPPAMTGTHAEPEREMLAVAERVQIPMPEVPQDMRLVPPKGRRPRKR